MRIAFVVAVVVLLGACSQNCAKVGCTSGALVDLTALPLAPGRSSVVTICINNHCQTQRPSSVPLTFATASMPTVNASKVTISLRMVGPDGSLIATDSTAATLQKLQPNGAQCGPTCYVAKVRLTAQGKLDAT